MVHYCIDVFKIKFSTKKKIAFKKETKLKFITPIKQNSNNKAILKLTTSNSKTKSLKKNCSKSYD